MLANQRAGISLNLNVRGMAPSATVAINDRANALRKQGREIFKLGLGQSPFPVPGIIVDALRRHAHERDYLPVQGLPELRETIADQHKRTFGIHCSADDVFIGPGSKELIFLLQLSYYGDLVIPAPAWVSYAPQARIIGRQITQIPTSLATDWFPTADQIAQLCEADPDRPRILILNYPSNPTGRTLTKSKLAELVAVVRRYNVIILSDEIYAKLDYADAHQSVAPLYPEGTIFSGGLSKWCGAGGWRLGVFVFPPNFRWLSDAMAAVATETFTSTSTPIQYAAVSAFQGHAAIDCYLGRARRILRSLALEVYTKLRSAGADVLKPDGGFYVFPDFSPLANSLRARGINDSKTLCTRLLDETGVAILPGVDFGRPASELTARIAFVDFDGGAALQAAAELNNLIDLNQDFVHVHCHPVIDAIDRLCEWLQKPARQISGVPADLRKPTLPARLLAEGRASSAGELICALDERPDPLINRIP